MDFIRVLQQWKYLTIGQMEGRSQGHLASLLHFYEVVILFSTLQYLMCLFARGFIWIVTTLKRSFGSLEEDCRLSVVWTLW